MDLRQLSYLVAVGDEGGIRAAARRLHISQPQVSQALRRLESELGVELMRRSSRGVALTAEGEELLAHGREILDRVSLARTTLRRMADQQSSTLRVGVVAGVLSAGELLAPILAAFGAARPDVALRLEDLAFNDQVSPLLAGTVDAAIVRAPVSHPDIVMTPIAQEPRVVWSRRATSSQARRASTSTTSCTCRRSRSPPRRNGRTSGSSTTSAAARTATRTSRRCAPSRGAAGRRHALGDHHLAGGAGRLAPNPLVRAIGLTDAARR